MRVAEIAAAAAAVLAIPLAVELEKPSVSSDQFVQEVRCVAYADIAGPDAYSALKWRLNAEAQRQPEEVRQAAKAAVEAVAERAATARSVQVLQWLRAARAEACAQSRMFAGADAGGNG